MGLFRTAGRAAVAGSVVGRVQRKQQLRFAAEDAAAAAAAAPVAVAAPAAAPVAAPPSSMDLTDHKLSQLKQLGELRAAGVLTESEFLGEKAKILAL
ncbi:SHOCT domain-containing protein [Paeniglutamicibacter sp. NPDC012692]|uniref:SHOCT domain-containing protein n=1 Tax=Paeniglutamicibacter sp. NPDC012692 TaxID=3364388 RepID=UPI003676B0FC